MQGHSNKFESSAGINYIFGNYLGSKAVNI